MSWGTPIILWGLIGPAVGLLALTVLAFNASRRTWTRWPAITRVIAVGRRVHPVGLRPGTRRPWLLLVALALILVALARPRWGVIEEPVVQKAREVMIALDLSRSMLAKDVPPSRLERSRLLVRSLLDGLRGERVGLVVFAGTAFVQVPMSADYQILHEFLPDLNPAYMPQGGTDYDAMLRAVLGGFSDTASTDHYLIVLSDGESTTEGWRERLPELKKRNMHVITLGVGTTAGGFIPDDETGGFVKDARGAVVLSRLETATLQALATATAGTYRDASSWVDLATVLKETVGRGEQGAFAQKLAPRQIERFQWFLGPALVFAFAGLWRELGIRPRARQIRNTTTASASRSLPGAAASTVSAAAVALLLALASPNNGRAAVEDTTPENPVDRLRATVTRLAAIDDFPAAGWKAMAEQTLEWGKAEQKEKKPVDPGPVLDALAAVDLGENAAPGAADWATLRAGLQKLLEPPQKEKQEEKQDEQQQDQQQDQEQQQQQDQQSQDQKQSDSSQDQQNQQQQQQQKKQQEEQQAAGEQKSAEQQQQEQDAKEKEKEEAEQQQGGQKPEPKPKTRKFGGKPASEETDQPEDPELAAALARLRQVDEKDSPARLHQLLQGQLDKPAKPERDW